MIEPKIGPSYALAEQGIMWTRQCKPFNLVNPDPYDVRIEDIAAGLSKICRFTGQCSVVYTVGEHSGRVALNVMGKTDNPRVWLLALLHDAQEAYCNDLSRPNKMAMRILMQEIYGTSETPYDILERRIFRAIQQRFQLPTYQHWIDMVKAADNEVYVDEAQTYMTGRKDVVAMSPETAEKHFLAMFYDITRTIARMEGTRVAA